MWRTSNLHDADWCTFMKVGVWRFSYIHGKVKRINSGYRSELPWGLLTLCRRTLGSERHRYAIAWLDKLGTDPMVYGGFINGRRRGTQHQIQPEYGDEQADAGRDGWTRLARPNSQAHTGTGEYSFSLFSWPRAGLATLPGWSILCCMWSLYIHTYILLVILSKLTLKDQDYSISLWS